jgi:cell division protein FtsZ
MLDKGESLTESAAVLVSMVSGPDLSMAEVNRVMEEIQRHCEHSHVLMGAAVDESFGDRLAVTLVVTRKSEEETPETSRSGTGEGLDTQLLTRTETSRPGSRFVPPPPALEQNKLEQMLKNQPRSRTRKKQIKMLQGQLPLEIISKGRFDKSEPTIHQGEDLDVPTYIRRGISLN